MDLLLRLLLLILVIGLEAVILKVLLKQPKKKAPRECYTYTRPTRVTIDWLPYQEEIDKELDNYLTYLEVKKRIQERNKEYSYRYVWNTEENIRLFRKRYNLVS